MVTNRSSRNYNQEYPMTNRNYEPPIRDRYAGFNNSSRNNPNYSTVNYNSREPNYSYNSQPYPIRNNDDSYHYPMYNNMERTNRRVNYNNYYQQDNYYPQPRNRNLDGNSGRNNYNYNNYNDYSQPVRYPSNRYREPYNQPNYDNYTINDRRSNFRDSRNNYNYSNYNDYPQDRRAYATTSQDPYADRYNNRQSRSSYYPDYPEYNGNRRKPRESY
ncbi:hypothetical protein HAV_00453 [Candidatus Hepatincola sp. Av]